MNAMIHRIMVSGWACRQRVLSNGRRQITSFILPGDVIGNLPQPEMPTDYSLVALTQVVTMDGSGIMAAVASGDPAFRGLACAIRSLAPHETTLMYDQIVRLGRQSAYERMVHLMLELHARLQVVGKAGHDTFPMPLTQDILGDALGLSVVHVNRTIRQVRHDGLLDIRSGRVKLLDLKAMRAVADWMPSVHQ